MTANSSITVALAGSEGKHFGFSPLQVERLAKAERKRYPRRMNRCVKHSKGYQRNKRQAAKQTSTRRMWRATFWPSALRRSSLCSDSPPQG